MTKVEKAVKYIVEIANDDSHGYSQINRDGNPDFDCSSLVIHVLKKAGFKMTGATYTGNMLDALKKDGFVIPKDINLKTGAGLEKGDILLTPNKHVVMYVGNKKVCGARSDEKGGIKGEKKGDQTGNEICVHDYFNYPWKHVLRFVESVSASIDVDSLACDVIYGKYGNGEERKKALGKNYEKVQGRVNEYYHLAKLIMKGGYGNGEERKRAVRNAGYNYEVAQGIVNELVKLKWKI